MSEPTKGSFIILNAKPENGCESSADLSIFLSSLTSPGLKPKYDGTSRGDGKKSITAFNRGWTPLFLKAEPHNTGTNVIFRVPSLKSFLISSTVGSFPSR